MTMLCDRCETPYRVNPDDLGQPLCPHCLAGTRRAELGDGANPPRSSPFTRAEFETAARTARRGKIIPFRRRPA